MIKVPGHGGIDVEHERELLIEDRERLARVRRYWEAELNAYHVYASANARRRMMDRLALLEPDSDELRELAHDVCYARVALFTYRHRPERNQWHLVGETRQLTGEAPPEGCRLFHWKQAFWFAWAIHDAESLALLSYVPLDQIEDDEQYDRPLVKAIQSLFFRRRSTGQDLIEALELADPDRAQHVHPDAVLDLIVPVIECLVPLAERSPAGLAEKLQKLLELRRDYNSRPDRAHNGGLAAYLAEDAVGIAAWARTLGIDIDIESPYVPKALLATPEPPVRACVDCATPMQDVCQACGRTTEGDPDDVLAFGFRAWLNLERDPCRHCAHPFPIIVNKCPVCWTLRRGTA